MSKMKPVRSLEYFLHKLRSAESIKPDVFKEIFASYKDCLSAGLTYYRSRKAQSKRKEDLMKEAEIDEQMASFIVDISETLDLDLTQSYETFCGYLLYAYADPSRDINAVLSDTANKIALLGDVQSYHHREQLALLLSIIEILKRVQRSHSQLPHLVTLEDFVYDKLATPALVDSLLVSLRDVWERPIDKTAPAIGSPSNAVALARHAFSLQEHLVRVLIWLFYVSELPVDCDAGVLKFFIEQNFGRKQFYKKLLPIYESEELINRIFNLEILFTLKSFHLESLQMAYLDENRDKDTYWLDEKLAKKVASQLDSFISPTSHDHAALALAYTLNCQLRRLIASRDKAGSSDYLATLDVNIHKYGYIAKRNGCLKFCIRLLASSAITDDPDMKSLARAAISVALDGCLQFFEADSIGHSEDLITLFSDVLRDASVAEAFWSNSFSTGVSNYVLNEIVYQFYASFRRPLRVLEALASASVDSCQKVIKLCQRLPVFSEPIDQVDPNDLAITDDVEDMQDDVKGPSFILIKPRQPFGIDGPVLPEGTRGRVIKSTFSPEEYAQWEFPYNAWQICLLEITRSQGNPERVAVVLDLVGQILKTDPSSVTLFVHFLTEAIGILKRSRYFDAELIVSLLEPCFRCLAGAAKTFPYEVLAQIGDDDILPSSKPLSQAEFRLSLLSRILNDVERLSGRYGCTISFLQLIENCCEEAACYALPSFAGSISYICDHIFSDCLSWPYETTNHRNEIAMSCLRICRKILEKWTAASEENRAALKEIVVICRKAVTQGEARRSLLRLASVGIDALKDSYYVTDDGSGQDQLAETVSLALALLLELLIDFENSRTNGATPQVFVDLFLAVTSVNVGMEPPLCAIGRYLLLKTNDRIPKLAVICLKRIAMLFPATILSTFGEWTSAFCDAFLTRLESPSEDSQLKVYCIEFLTASVKHQPGLAEQLLGVSSTSDGNGVAASSTDTGSKPTSNSGALDCILALMKSDRILPDLAIACVNLLSTIWITNTSTAMDYLREKKGDEFWTTLLAPLLAGEDSYYLSIVAPVYRILTRELLSTGANSFVSKLKAANGAGDGKSPGRTTIVTTVLQKSMEAERLRLTFEKLRDYCESRIDFKDKVEVLGACRDLLQTVFANKGTNGGLGEDGKREILTGSTTILKKTLYHFEQQGGIAIVKAASELCGLAVKYCLRLDGLHGQKSAIKDFESVFDRLNDGHLEEWLLQLSVIVLPVCCTVFRPPELNKEDTDAIPSIFDTVCSILVKNLIQTATLRSKDLLGSPNYPWLKALQSTLRCLALLYRYVSNVTERRLLDVLQKHSVLRNLRVLLAFLLETGYFDTSLLCTVCLLFTLTAKSLESLSLIRYSGFLEWICVDLIMAPKAIVYDMDVLSALFAVHIAILEAGTHHAVPACAAFVASYSDMVVQLLLSLSAAPTVKTAKAVARLMQLLISLADYKDRWQLEALDSQALMIDTVCLLCYRLPLYLAKPAVLAEMLAKEERNVPAAATATTVTSSDPKVAFMQRLLIEILYSAIQFLLRFSPDLLDACNNPSFDAESFRPLLTLDLNTNLALDAPSVISEDGTATTVGSTSFLTFGAVLLVVHLCVNSLRKSEIVRSASPSAHRATAPPLLTSAGDKGVITALLESSLYFVLSQATLHIKRGCLADPWKRTLLKRDLGAELSQYLNRCGIRSGTGSSPSTPRKSPATTPSMQSAASPGAAIRIASAGFNYEFLKFVSDFVTDVLRNND